MSGLHPFMARRIRAPKFPELVARIRAEASIADRPGQMQRLEQIADELEEMDA